MDKLDKMGVSVRDAAESTGLSESFIRLKIRLGEIQAIKIGSKVSIPVESLREFYNGYSAWTPGRTPAAAVEARRKAN